MVRSRTQNYGSQYKSLCIYRWMNKQKGLGIPYLYKGHIVWVQSTPLPHCVMDRQGGVEGGKRSLNYCLIAGANLQIPKFLLRCFKEHHGHSYQNCCFLTNIAFLCKIMSAIFQFEGKRLLVPPLFVWVVIIIQMQCLGANHWRALHQGSWDILSLREVHQLSAYKMNPKGWRWV